MASNRKKPLTREQLAEAAALKRLYDERVGDSMSQALFAETYDLGGTQGIVWQYLNGKIRLNLEAAIKFADGLKCDVADFSPRLAEILARGRRNDARADRYEIPDHMLHQLLADFQELGRAKRQEILNEVRAAVLGDRELASRGISTNYPTDKHIEKALKVSPSRLKEPVPMRRPRKQLTLFGAHAKKKS